MIWVTRLPRYYLVHNFLLFGGGHPQIDAGGLYALVTHQIRQQSYVVVFFNEIPFHSPFIEERPCKIPSKDFQNF